MQCQVNFLNGTIEFGKRGGYKVYGSHLEHKYLLIAARLKLKFAY